MKITKKYTRKITYSITAVHKFATFKEIKESRKRVFGEPKMQGLTTCLKCNYQFNDEDTVFLAYNENGKNKFFCEKCAAEFGRCEKPKEA